MASVNLKLSYYSNEINLSPTSKEIIEFNNKWLKIVEQFEGSLFVEGGDDYMWLLTSPDEEIDISTSDYAGLEDGPNKSRAIFKLLSYVTSTLGDCDFGYGETPFDKEFYADLLKLSKIDNRAGGYYFCANVTVNGYSGYYSGSYEFLPEGGIEKSFTFYNDDVDDNDE